MTAAARASPPATGRRRRAVLSMLVSIRVLVPGKQMVRAVLIAPVAIAQQGDDHLARNDAVRGGELRSTATAATRAPSCPTASDPAPRTHSITKPGYCTIKERGRAHPTLS